MTTTDPRTYILRYVDLDGEVGYDDPQDWGHPVIESGEPTEWEMRDPAFRAYDVEYMRAALEAVAPLIAAKALRDAAEAREDRRRQEAAEEADWAGVARAFEPEVEEARHG